MGFVGRADKSLFYQKFILSEETCRAGILGLPDWKVIEDMTVHFKCSVC